MALFYFSMCNCAPNKVLWAGQYNIIRKSAKWKRRRVIPEWLFVQTLNERGWHVFIRFTPLCQLSSQFTRTFRTFPKQSGVIHSSCTFETMFSADHVAMGLHNLPTDLIRKIIQIGQEHIDFMRTVSCPGIAFNAYHLLSHSSYPNLIHSMYSFHTRTLKILWNKSFRFPVVGTPYRSSIFRTARGSLPSDGFVGTVAATESSCTCTFWTNSVTISSWESGLPSRQALLKQRVYVSDGINF